MPIIIADKLKSGTAEQIVADANEIEYDADNPTDKENTVAYHLRQIHNSTVYLTEDEYELLVKDGQIDNNVEYNIYEE